MSYGFVIGLFDFKIGPYPVYFRNVSKDVASKIVIKGTIFQGSLQTTQSSGESIISFPSQSISAYIYLFLQIIDGKEFPILVAFVTNIKDQSSLYRDAEDLRSISNQIKDEIMNLQNYESSRTLSQDIETIMESKFTESYLNDIFNQNIKQLEKMDFHNNDIQIKPLGLVSHIVKKNFDQVLYGLIIGEPIVIRGNDDQIIKLMIDTFALITPHRKIRSIILQNNKKAEDYTALYDIVGTTYQIKANKSFILIDLEKGKIKGGRKNRYCEQMWTDLVEAEKRNTKLLQMLANRRVNWLLTSVSAITKGEDEETQKDTIKSLTQKIDRDSLYLIAKLIEEKNPMMFKHIISSYNLRSRFFKSIF